ncbi:hypothetical protein Bca101_041946 [Brassica carinata]
MKELIRRAKEEKQLRKSQPCRVLEHPPDNGLLVHVAQRVHRCRVSFCSEVHIGEIRTCTGAGSGSRSGTHVWKRGRASDVVLFPKSFHLYDRAVRPRVIHDERFTVPKISAVLELCIQAGVEIEKFPSKRRSKPVYCIEGRIVDFEDVNRERRCQGTDGEIQRFYGKAPAVVELCVQGCAPVPEQYKSMMRLDVVYPQRDEVDLVA